MTEYERPKAQALSSLKDKVVVLTGGASGICAALVKICHEAGAHVFFGDVVQKKGEEVEAELQSSSRRNHAQFIKTDVTSYSDNVNLFQVAYETFGRVDHAVSAAGIGDKGKLCDPNLTLETVRNMDDSIMTSLDVNLVGPMYFARIAAVYLREHKDRSAATAADKSLTLISSIAGITEAPGLTVYSTAKHGVIGLMRALRKPLNRADPFPIRTNAICPWMTETQMVKGIRDEWLKAGVPTNEPYDVAIIMAGKWKG
ncbi:NAD(P)-binding protein [Myriangium duriaei CBS 260.36]|uniref:NAD(P)-binding protein n=1 Tax=Myriangium duriaei CBS 260.36 TaxID=1168546 RepID=A0A9P4JBN4_9PEZI|nr:NAD(P)-binding protein [Myriangium duriaei CBS 260.36]